LELAQDFGKEDSANLVERAMAVARILQRSRKQNTQIRLKVTGLALTPEDIQRLEALVAELEFGKVGEYPKSSPSGPGWEQIEVYFQVSDDNREYEAAVRDNVGFLSGSTWGVRFRYNESGFYELISTNKNEH